MKILLIPGNCRQTLQETNMRFFVLMKEKLHNKGYTDCQSFFEWKGKILLNGGISGQTFQIGCM